jgi:cardiolipin synthase
MSTTLQRERMERASAPPMRELAGQAFSRAAGAPLVEGNSVRLLIDARENYPAWLEAIGDAQHHINFESYIIHEDSAGWRFADALVAKARNGVRVRLVYDWMGGFGKTSSSFWNHLRAGGVEVRCYNPPRFDSPLGWLSREHSVSIGRAMQTTIAADPVMKSEFVRDPAHLIVLRILMVHSHDFL